VNGTCAKTRGRRLVFGAGSLKEAALAKGARFCAALSRCGMTSFSELPPVERAKRYRQLAEDARREAESAKGTMRESYLTIARQWIELADGLEKRIKGRMANGR